MIHGEEETAELAKTASFDRAWMSASPKKRVQPAGHWQRMARG